MSRISQGALGQHVRIGTHGDGIRRGVARGIPAAIYASPSHGHADDAMPFAAGMMLSCNPRFANDDGLHGFCGTVLMDRDSTGRLHNFSEIMTELER